MHHAVYDLWSELLSPSFDFLQICSTSEVEQIGRKSKLGERSPCTLLNPVIACNDTDLQCATNAKQGLSW